MGKKDDENEQKQPKNAPKMNISDATNKIKGFLPEGQVTWLQSFLKGAYKWTIFNPFYLNTKMKILRFFNMNQ